MDEKELEAFLTWLKRTHDAYISICEPKQNIIYSYQPASAVNLYRKYKEAQNGSDSGNEEENRSGSR